MKIGGLSSYVRVVNWLEYEGFRVGARVTVSKIEMPCKRFSSVESEMHDNTAHGEYVGVETISPGWVYELSMYELLCLGDCPELNFKFDNCYLNSEIVSRDPNNRVVLEFCERGFGIETLTLGSEEYLEGISGGTVVSRDWTMLGTPKESVEVVEKEIKEVVEEPKGYGTSIEIG